MTKKTTRIIHNSGNDAGFEVLVSTDVKVVPSDPKSLIQEVPNHSQQTHSLGHSQTAQLSLPIIKPGYQTSEFWVTIIAQIVGVLTAMGYISPGHSTDLSNSINTIVGAVMSILPAVAYIFNRTWLKTRVEREQENEQR